MKMKLGLLYPWVVNFPTRSLSVCLVVEVTPIDVSVMVDGPITPTPLVADEPVKHQPVNPSPPILDESATSGKNASELDAQMSKTPQEVKERIGTYTSEALSECIFLYTLSIYWLFK